MAKRKGYAVVEPNYLTGIIDATFYDQYPADKAVLGDTLENGRFVKVSKETIDVDGKKVVNVTNGAKGVGEWYMIYNEEIHYDEREEGHRFFAMKASDYYTGFAVPRCIAIHTGDRFTTNAIPADGFEADSITGKSDVELTDYAIGDLLTVGENGYLTKCDDADAAEIVFQVIPDFRGGMATTPDGGDAVKIIRIK